MFENLTDRLESVFKKLRGQGVLTEENIQEAMHDVRTALLEADVNLGVVRDFVSKVTAKAVGQDVLDSLSPASRSSRWCTMNWCGFWAARPSP